MIQWKSHYSRWIPCSFIVRFSDEFLMTSMTFSFKLSRQPMFVWQEDALFNRRALGRMVGGDVSLKGCCFNSRRSHPLTEVGSTLCIRFVMKMRTTCRRAQRFHALGTSPSSNAGSERTERRIGWAVLFAQSTCWYALVTLKVDFQWFSSTLLDFYGFSH